jgi:hypothetical protein
VLSLPANAVAFGLLRNSSGEYGSDLLKHALRGRELQLAIRYYACPFRVRPRRSGMSVLRLLHPNDRTLAHAVEMSVRCQQPTSTLVRPYSTGLGFAYSLLDPTIWNEPNRRDKDINCNG